MALIPLFLDYLDERPSRLLDQHFGHGLSHDDLFAPLTVPRRHYPSYYRPWRSAAATKDTGSTVSLDKEKFQVNLDVQQFGPEEITVKLTGDNTITVEGKHEEKPDEHGFISRHFVRRYIVPKGHHLDRVESKLSSDGVLTITAPKISQEALEHKEIPVVKTGKPLRPVEPKAEENGTPNAE